MLLGRVDGRDYRLELSRRSANGPYYLTAMYEVEPITMGDPITTIGDRITTITVRGQKLYLGAGESRVRELLREAGVMTPVHTEAKPNPKLPDTPLRVEHYEVDRMKFGLVFQRRAVGQPYWIVEITRD